MLVAANATLLRPLVVVLAMRVSRLLPGLLAGVLLLGGVGAARAATARSSAIISIYDGPGYLYAPIGKLASG